MIRWERNPPRPILAKFESLRSYKNDWHFGQGEAFASTVIERAQYLSEVAIVMGFGDQDVHPGHHGNLLLSIYMRERTIEINVLGDDTYDFDVTRCAPELEVSYESISIDQVLEFLREQTNVWTSSESWGTMILTFEMGGSKSLHSSQIDAIANQYRSSKRDALRKQAGLFATMLRRGTPARNGNVLFSGDSRLPSLKPIAS